VDRTFLGFAGRAAGRALPAGRSDSLQGEPHSDRRPLRHLPSKYCTARAVTPRNAKRNPGRASFTAPASKPKRSDVAQRGATWRDVPHRLIFPANSPRPRALGIAKPPC